MTIAISNQPISNKKLSLMKSNSLQNTFKLLLCLVVTLATFAANAQQLTVYGDGDIPLGQQRQYYVTTSASSYQWTIQSDGGQIIGSSTGSTVWVKAIADQTINLRIVLNNGSGFGQKNITVSCDNPGFFTAVTPPTCDTSTGAVTVNPTASGTYTYSFNNGATYQNSNTKSGLAIGNHFIKLKNSFGCITTKTTTIPGIPTPPSKPTIASNSTTQMCMGDRAYIYLNNPQGSPILYRWYNSAGIHRSTGTSWNLRPLNVSGPFTYTVRAYNTVTKCLSSPTSFTINIINMPTPALSSVTQPTCSNSKGTFTITNFSASNNYTITPSTGVTRSGGTITAPQGNYTVTATGSGCTSTASASRTVNAQPTAPGSLSIGTVTQPTCASTNGSFRILNYNSGYTYNFSPSTGVSLQGNLVSAPSAVYSITATSNVNNCTGPVATVPVNAAPSAPSTPSLSSVTQPNCTNSKGIFTISNFSSSNTYIISPSTGVSISGATITAPQGSYTVKASKNGCTSSSSSSRTVNTQPSTPGSLSIGAVTQPTCSTPNGSFRILNYNAAYTYIFSPSSGVSLQGNLVSAPSGVYSVYARSSNNCTGPIATVTINNAPAAPPTPSLSSVTQPSCSNVNGTFTISNFSSSNSYTISPSSGVSLSGATITAPQGSYTVTATANGCTSASSVSRTVNNQPSTPPTPTLSPVTQPSCTIATGTFTITNYNASYTYTFLPSSGVVKNGAIVTAPQGNYTVRATLNGCISGISQSRTINSQPAAPATPQLSTTITQPTCTSPTGSFTITNFNSDYTYTVTPSTGVTFFGSEVRAPQGTYILTASNNGCTSAASSSRTINGIPSAPSAPTLDLLTQPTCAVSTGSFKINDYNSNYTYVIIPSGGTSISGDTITANEGSYTVRALVSGCTSPSSLAVQINGQPITPTETPTFVQNSLQQANCNNPKASIQLANYNAAYSYTFSPSAGIDPLQGNLVRGVPGVYTITVTSIDGSCVGPSTTMDLGGFDGPQAPLQPTLVLDAQPVCATENGSFIIQNYSSTGFVYEITPSIGLFGPDANGRVLAPAGNYTVTRRTGNCTSGDSNSIAIVAPSNACPEACTLTGVSQENPEFGPEADMVLLTFEGELNCALQVTQKPDWITYELVSNSQIRLSSTANTGLVDTGVVHIKQDGGVLDPFIINVTRLAASNFPGNPDDPTIVGDGCGDAVLQRIPDNEIPTGETWYWQGNNPIGTSIEFGSGETFTIENFSVDDNYYIRAYKNGNWSAELGVVYVPFKALPEITSVGVAQPNCDSTTGTISVNVASNSDTGDYTYSFDGGNTYQTSNTKSGFAQGTHTVFVNNEGCISASQTAIVNAPPTSGCGIINYTGENYVYSRTYQKERSGTPTAFFTENADLIQEITYFDGLGRDIQSIGIDQSPDNNDIVTYMEYDDFGRMEKDWLSIPVADGNPGRFKTLDLKTEINTYYQNNYGADFTTEINPYSQKLFDSSPLNRIEKQAAPGEDWKLNPNGDDHSIEMKYQGNSSTDNVKEYRVDASITTVNEVKTYTPSLIIGTSNNGNYDVAVLNKTVTYDENHSAGKDHSTEEFTDKQGRLVLKRNYDAGIAHDTYYVYNDFGNLSYVLPPKMEGSIASLSSINGNMNALGYQYVYDHRNRLVEKRIPGKGWEYIIYNKIDQPIMTQDANQMATGEWLFSKYDAFGRIAYTGIATSPIGTSRTVIQKEVNDFNGALWVNQSIAANSFGQTTLFYTNGAYPTQNSTIGVVLSEVFAVNYYDAYVNHNTNVPTSIIPLGETLAFNASANNVKGLATGSRIKVLETNDWLTSATYYDDKARPIYSHSRNDFLGTTDIIETELDFIGNPLKSRTTHQRGGTTIVTIDNFTYDHAGRLLAQTQCIGDATLGTSCEGSGGGGAPANLILNGIIDTDQVATSSILHSNGLIQPQNGGDGSTLYSIDPNATGGSGEAELIVLNTYDELGQLENKKVGGDANGTSVINSTGLQTVKYQYNVRGWVTAINDVNNPGNDLFNYRLAYNEGPNALYNGNIALSQWKTLNNNSSVRTYNYTYDALNRIKTATDNLSNYSLSGITYDKNGNINGLNRRGNDGVTPTSTNYGVIDNLDYDYDSGNKLLSVTDSATGVFADQGFKDGTTTGDDYAYDLNGNMVSDANKGISTITYNHLNLPDNVSINNTQEVGTITYIYDASGQKIQKNVLKNGVNTPTDYAGSYIYENNTLQFFNHMEGYAAPKNINDFSQGFEYVYNYKDHLNNTRLSYTDANNDGSISTNEIVKESNYYPFGLSHEGYNNTISSLGNSVAKRYMFGGKEYQTELNLDWYDVSARNYDPALGRWMNLDPLAEKGRRHSPYNYAFDNPIRFVDYDGMWPSWDDVLDAAQTTLDVVGMIPAVGNIADIANAGISGGRAAYAAANGDMEAAKEHTGNAAFSLAAAVPGAGLVVGGAKIAKKVYKAVKTAKTAKKAKATLKTADKAKDAGKAVNGNSKASEKAQHVYGLVNLNVSKTAIEKVGISGGTIGKNTKKSYRATSQVNELNKVAGNKYTSVILEEIPAGTGARVKALKAEVKHATLNKATLNPAIHKLPKPQ